jgi:DNA-binding helix-hairpin-helix protein with protein kinase domain
MLSERINTSNIQLFSGSGQNIVISRQLGHGGEGTVYELEGTENLIAKVYDPGKLGQKGSKIKAMISLKTDKLLQVTAWPIDTVHLKPGGNIVGLLEHKAVGFKDIHLLYSPKSRKAEFPSAKWNFLVWTAINLAKAFNTIHEHGLVIGDVNPTNIMVSPKALVKLIDCDSFQVSLSSSLYPCGIGTPIYTPPELQNSDLTNIIRTKNHDNFGLAVVIFHLLILGRHPFAGKYLQTGEMPPEKAIAEFRFAYGSQAHTRFMEQPPNTLLMREVSEPIEALFNCAFQPQATSINTRPSPQEWINALDGLLHSLIKCNQNTAHIYYKGVISCPWCAFEQNGIVFFDSIISGTESSDETSFNLESVWAQITQIPSPGPLPSLPSENMLGVTKSSSVNNYHLLRLIIRIGAIGILTIVLVLVIGYFHSSPFWSILAWLFTVIIVWNITKTKRILSEKKEIAQQRLNSLLDRLKKEASDVEYVKTFSELQHIRNQYTSLPETRLKRIQDLNKNIREYQLQSYLDQFRVEHASILGIGPSKKAMLLSYAIETAADVYYSKIDAVPGFGPYLSNKVVAWRKKLEQNFVFNPRQGIDPGKISAIDRDIRATRTQLQSSLLVGANRLTVIVNKIKHTRDTLWPDVLNAYKELVQAKLDLKFP